jgi:hypothetical protein
MTLTASLELVPQHRAIGALPGQSHIAGKNEWQLLPGGIRTAGNLAPTASYQIPDLQNAAAKRIL